MMMMMMMMSNGEERSKGLAAIVHALHDENEKGFARNMQLRDAPQECGLNWTAHEAIASSGRCDRT